VVRIRDSRSGIRKKNHPDPDPWGKKAPDPGSGSATLANKENTTRALTDQPKQLDENSLEVHRRENVVVGARCTEDSESEEEGWNGGLNMFYGLVNLNKDHYKEEIEANINDEEEEEERVHCEISDEDDFVILSSQRDQGSDIAESDQFKDNEPQVSDDEMESQIKVPESGEVCDNSAAAVIEENPIPCLENQFQKQAHCVLMLTTIMLVIVTVTMVRQLK
jgi:hypothetical protein